MVRGVAGHKFVKQCRGDIGVQPGHEAGSGTDEVGIDIFEAGTIAPEGILGLGLPEIMDVAESQPMLIRKIVVDAHQFFAPGFCK